MKNTQHMVLFLFVAMIISIAAGTIHVGALFAAEQEQCVSGITSTEASIGGYISPISNVSGVQELLLSVKTCTDSIVAVSAGAEEKSTFVHETGYAWNGSDWESFTFTSDGRMADGWIEGKAQAAIVTASSPWVIAYLCEKTNVWGCDNQGGWTLQQVVRDVVYANAGEESTETTFASELIVSQDDSKWIIGHYHTSDWGIIEPFDIPWEHLTHVVLGDTREAWGSVDVYLDIPNADIKDIWYGAELEDAIQDAHTAEVVPLLSLGSGEPMNDEWREFLETDELLNQTVYTLKDKIVYYGFEGINVHWSEISDEELERFNEFVAALKELLPDLVISYAVPYVEEGDDANEHYVSMEPIVDRFTVMIHPPDAVVLEYEESGQYSPLFATDDEYPLSLETSVAAYRDAGIPAGKINIEVPLHGQCWEEVDGPGEEIVDKTEISGLISLWDIVNERETRQAMRWDDTT